MKKGISLIVLVITIVVIIILAAAVILSLGDNNPINSSRVAKLLQDKDSIESSILTYTSSIQAKTLGENTLEEIIRGNTSKTSTYGIVGVDTLTNKDGEIIYNIDKTKYDERVNTLPDVTGGSWYVNAQGNIYLVYNETSNIPSWVKDNETLSGFVLSKDNKEYTAKAVEKNPDVYYGATVTNYSANGVSDFRVFHSDGKNIYLISSDYIPVDKIPLTKSGNKLENTDSTFPKGAPLTNAVSDTAYATGSAAIEASNPAREWLASYLDNYSSTGDNMKAVAYLMDISVWNAFKSEKAEYAIGGPTIDMLFASYNKKYKTNYQARAKNATGYEISKDSGVNWANNYDSMLNTSDSLYIITSTSNAQAYWSASPSAGAYDYVIRVNFHTWKNPGYSYSGNAYLGFRPVVCLKSNISLIANDNGSVTLV